MARRVLVERVPQGEAEGHRQAARQVRRLRQGVRGVPYTAGMGGEVDHGRALCEGGGNEVENLTLRCKSCHKKRDDARRAANR